MIEFGSLEGRTSVEPSVKLDLLVWTYDDVVSLEALTFKIELFKAYPVVVDA